MQKVTVIRTVLNDKQPSLLLQEAMTLKNTLENMLQHLQDRDRRNFTVKVEACNCQFSSFVHYVLVLEEELSNVRHIDPSIEPGEETLACIYNLLRAGMKEA